MTDKYVSVTVSDFVATVKLNRPPVNAFTRDMRRQFIAAFDELSERSDVRVAILAAEGKTFCGGVDLRDRPDPSVVGQFSETNRLMREMLNVVKECPRPVIAAVNGAAVGAGFGIAAACDIIIASRSASFGMPEIDVGLAGGAAMLHELFGRFWTRQLLFTGERVPAETLYRLGIVTQLVDPSELDAAATELARKIASKSPRGIRYAKRSANLVALMSPRDAYRFEQDFTRELADTEDALEARTAYMERRAPVFNDH